MTEIPILIPHFIFSQILTISFQAWLLYTRLPIASARLPREQLALRTEVLKIKREMHATSSQDEFAKWARIRRQHDKKQAEYDEKSAQIQAFRSQFDTVVGGGRWVFTTGMQTLIQFWHAKTPVFEYPRGWLPWYVEWVLGFPRAPYGGVSVNVWAAACRAVVTMGGDAITAVVVGMLEKQQQKGGKKPVMVGATTSNEKKANEKKEL